MVRDSAHRVVLKVTRLTAQADVLDILQRIVRGDEKLTIDIDHVRVEHAEADIIPAEDGLPTLAHAFMPAPVARRQRARRRRRSTCASGCRRSRSGTPSRAAASSAAPRSRPS